MEFFASDLAKLWLNFDERIDNGPFITFGQQLGLCGVLFLL